MEKSLKKYLSDGVVEMVSAGTREKAIEFMEGLEGRLLNVGCNHGSPSRFIPDRFEVHNCDIEDLDRENFTQVDLNNDWPYESNQFDIVTGVEIIEHLENPWHMLRECKRVVDIGGTVIITTPNILSQKDREMFYEEGTFRWFGPEYLGPGRHINPIPRWELEYIIKNVGLTQEKLEYNKPDEEILITELKNKQGVEKSC